MYTHKKPAPAARGRRSIALFLAADILAAALLVFGNYYLLYEAPIRGLSGGFCPAASGAEQHSAILPSAGHSFLRDSVSTG